jgi:hypothetical protein
MVGEKHRVVIRGETGRGFVRLSIQGACSDVAMHAMMGFSNVGMWW